MSATATRLSLDSPVAPLVDKRYRAALGRAGLVTVRDLLLHLPFDWAEYGAPTPIADLRPGRDATVIGQVVSAVDGMSHDRKIKFAKATVSDDTGRLAVVWFKQPWVAKQVRGRRIALAGEVRETRFAPFREMRNPDWEEVGEGGPRRVGGLMAKYHLKGNLTSKLLARTALGVLDLAAGLEEVLPDDVRERHHLLPIAEAVRAAHDPRSEDQWRAAKLRFAFAEAFELAATFLQMKRLYGGERATPVPYRQEVIDSFKAGLGFELTRAQRRATWDAFQDMQGDLPMNRLIDGDVGSGKTAVAAACAAMVHAAGLQTVVMAPTEILARQHLQKFRAYLEETFPDLRVDLLVSGLPAAERRRVIDAAGSGQSAVLVGTHALIEGAVQLAALGLAVVDEQHRFGTRQREALRDKAGASRPHFLAMTATPIPRTLALAVYGEMALSIIDELPPGRTPVRTQVVPPDQRERAYELVRSEARAGRQAFVICPLVEESESLEAKAATAEHERLQREVFPDLRLGLVHGRMKDKDEVMRRFRAREYDILVATPVIEVGVDVPNATVMVIEGADRFGLAQLHQFRGRVGRSDLASHCLLLADDPAPPSLRRLQLMEEVHDGFRLAEADMRMRGAGELLGSRQHGDLDAGMEWLEHPQLLSEARDEVERLLAEDPELERHPVLRGRVAERLAQTSIS